MNERKKIVFARAVYFSLMLVFVASLVVLSSVLNNDGGYSAGLIKPEIGSYSHPDTVSAGITEPDFSYERYSMTFVGSVNAGSMLGSSSFGTLNEQYSETGGGYFLSDLSGITKRDDMTLAFLSSVFSDSDELVPAQKSGGENVGWYKAPSANADILSLGGIEAVSLECSGVKDYGNEGYSDTKAAVESLGILWGDSGKAIYKVTTGGVKIALYPCSYREENVSGIINWIENASQSNDFVVVCISGGDGSASISDEKKTAFRSFIDSGADLVVGTNFEKTEPAVEYNGGFIAYSLGSLVDGADKYSEKYSALLGVELIIDEGKIKDIKYSAVPLRNYSESEFWHPSVISADENGVEYDEASAMLAE